MALKIIHVMEFQILFAQILFLFLMTSMINSHSSRKRQPIDFASWDVLAWMILTNRLRPAGLPLGYHSNIWLEIMCA